MTPGVVRLLLRFACHALKCYLDEDVTRIQQLLLISAIGVILSPLGVDNPSFYHSVGCGRFGQPSLLIIPGYSSMHLNSIG